MTNCFGSKRVQRVRSNCVFYSWWQSRPTSTSNSCPGGLQTSHLFLVTKYFGTKLSSGSVNMCTVPYDKLLWHQSYPEMERTFLFLVTRYLNKELMLTECTNDVSRHSTLASETILGYSEVPSCILLTKYFGTKRHKDGPKHDMPFAAKVLCHHPAGRPLVSSSLLGSLTTSIPAPWCQSTKVGFWSVLCQ